MNRAEQAVNYTISFDEEEPKRSASRLNRLLDQMTKMAEAFGKKVIEIKRQVFAEVSGMVEKLVKVFEGFHNRVIRFMDPIQRLAKSSVGYLLDRLSQAYQFFEKLATKIHAAWDRTRQSMVIYLRNLISVHSETKTHIKDLGEVESRWDRIKNKVKEYKESIASAAATSGLLAAGLGASQDLRQLNQMPLSGFQESTIRKLPSWSTGQAAKFRQDPSAMVQTIKTLGDMNPTLRKNEELLFKLGTTVARVAYYTGQSPDALTPVVSDLNKLLGWSNDEIEAFIPQLQRLGQEAGNMGIVVKDWDRIMKVASAAGATSKEAFHDMTLGLGAVSAGFEQARVDGSQLTTVLDQLLTEAPITAFKDEQVKNLMIATGMMTKEGGGIEELRARAKANPAAFMDEFLEKARATQKSMKETAWENLVGSDLDATLDKLALYKVRMEEIRKLAAADKTADPQRTGSLDMLKEMAGSIRALIKWIGEKVEQFALRPVIENFIYKPFLKVREVLEAIGDWFDRKPEGFQRAAVLITMFGSALGMLRITLKPLLVGLGALTTLLGVALRGALTWTVAKITSFFLPLSRLYSWLRSITFLPIAAKLLSWGTAAEHAASLWGRLARGAAYLLEFFGGRGLLGVLEKHIPLVARWSGVLRGAGRTVGWVVGIALELYNVFAKFKSLGGVTDIFDLFSNKLLGLGDKFEKVLEIVRKFFKALGENQLIKIMNPFMAGGFRKAAADIESVRTGQPPKYAKGGWTRFFETPFGTSDNEQEGLAWGGKQFGMAKTALNLMRPSAFVREGGSPAMNEALLQAQQAARGAGTGASSAVDEVVKSKARPTIGKLAEELIPGVKVLNVANDVVSQVAGGGSAAAHQGIMGAGPGAAAAHQEGGMGAVGKLASVGAGAAVAHRGAFGKLAETLSPAYRAYKWLTGRKGSAPEAGGVPGAAAAHQTAKGGGGGGDMESMIQAAAEANGVDPNLLRALVRQESGFNPGAVGPMTRFGQAKGLTQLIPGTAAELGLEPGEEFDPQKNLNAGAKYLSQQLKKFGSPELALAAYNAGPGAVSKYGGVPPFAQTQNYVAKIMAEYSRTRGTEAEIKLDQAEVVGVLSEIKDVLVSMSRGDQTRAGNGGIQPGPSDYAVSTVAAGAF